MAPISNYRDDVPPELDQAIRVCLERDPRNRYTSALEMAAALDAGLHGDSTAATAALTSQDRTQMFGAGDDATQALPATRHSPATGGWTPAPASPPQRLAEPPPRRRERQRKPRRNWASLLAILLIAALAVVAIVLLANQAGGQPYMDINAGNSVDQAAQLKQYVQHHRAKR